MLSLPDLLTTSLTYPDLVEALGAQTVELLCLRRLVQTLQAEIAALQAPHLPLNGRVEQPEGLRPTPPPN